MARFAFSTNMKVFSVIFMFNTISLFLTAWLSRESLPIGLQPSMTVVKELSTVIESSKKRNNNTVEMKSKGYSHKKENHTESLSTTEFRKLNNNAVEMKSKGYSHKKESHTEFLSTILIAAYPVNTDRLISVWSFLECFVDKRIRTIVVAAPDWAKDKIILEPFLRHATESIPHLKHIDIVIKYYVNDRYDVGLWCDSLQDENYKIFNDHDDFILINDSILALQRHTGVLDLLQTKNLTMTSLTYSNLGGYWLESFFRGFSKKGMKRYMQHACIPANHTNWCRNQTEPKRKRCIVDYFEIEVARIFPRQETAGMYSADVPHEMIKSKKMERPEMWHAHWPYWYTQLYKKGANDSFPIMKSSNKEFIKRAINWGVKGKRCVSHLDPAFLAPMKDDCGIQKIVFDPIKLK